MSDSVQYRYYTAKDLRDWLFQSIDNGLSEQIISKVRALALLHHPDVKDDSILVAVAFVNGEVAAYTAAFPENLVRPALSGFSFGTTLYTYPEYDGRALGYCVSMYMKEAYDYKYMSLDSTPTSTFIDQQLESKIEYYSRYKYILKRHIKIKSLRSILGFFNEKRRIVIQKKQISILTNKMACDDYKIEYTNFINEELYKFITEQSREDFFLRSREALNWILSDYFMISAPIIKRVQPHPFGGFQTMFRMFGVKVFYQNQLIGFYILRQKEHELALMYLYVLPEFKTKIYFSIAEHIFTLPIKTFTTFDEGFDQFFQSSQSYLKREIQKVSFTLPKDMELDFNLKLQGGDGDMMA